MATNSEIKKSFGILAVILCCLLLAGPASAGIVWVQKAKLIASDGAAYDYFGSSVSISGDKAIVGANGDDGGYYNSGSAYIFRWDGTSWVEQQKLTASDGAFNNFFGYSVSISGDYAIIGAYGDDDRGDFSGSAYIFRWNGANWIQQQKLTASDGADDDLFGFSVSISGDYAIVGARDDADKGPDSGSAYIFKRNGESWSQQQKLTASDGAAGDIFGVSVSISGDKTIVGALGDDDKGNYTGSAYIFKRDGTGWSQQAKLLAFDGAADDYFGCSVSISGDYAIIGADQYDGGGIGKAYIFKRDGESWIQQQKLTASDGAAEDFFGESVSISGDYAIVGAYGDDDRENDYGSAYIFKRNGESWIQKQKLLASDGAAGEWFGWSVSISGDYAIIGAVWDDEKGNDSGSAYIFIPTEIVTGELTLLAPNGGEKLVGGSIYDIIWDTNGVVENVFIEYSDNNEVDWKPIDTVANTGSYKWLVPKIDSNQCLVRISDAGYPPSFDISDDVFRIYVCTLVHDYNHDCFVDFLDFSHFATEWLRCGDPADPNCQP